MNKLKQFYYMASFKIKCELKMIKTAGFFYYLKHLYIMKSGKVKMKEYKAKFGIFE